MPAFGGSFVREPFEAVRATGMGNAFIALADDSNALWYNPAALTKVKGFHFNLFDLTLGTDSSDTITRIQKAVGGDYDNLLRETPQFLRFGVKPTFTMPYFGFAIYDSIQSYSNLAAVKQVSDMLGSTTTLPTSLPTSLPNVDVYAFNDIAAVLGFGLPIGDQLSIGASIRAIERTGIDASVDPLSLLLSSGATTSGQFLDSIYSHVKGMMGSGYGFGINIGALYQIPITGTKRGSGTKVQLAATIDDAGDTKFIALSGQNAPPPIRHSYNLGSALIYDLPKNGKLNLTLDFRHLFDGESFARMFHLGIEYRHKFFGIRTGLYQGYPCFGASLEILPHTRIHFSTYAAEMGSNFFESSQRFYLLQAIIGFNPF